MTNGETFINALEVQYKELFVNDPDYGYTALRATPEGLAVRITEGLIKGSANKDGKAIKNVCTQLGIKHTYKAIREYLLKGGA